MGTSISRVPSRGRGIIRATVQLVVPVSPPELIVTVVSEDSVWSVPTFDQA
jgi:hypothetical protein